MILQIPEGSPWWVKAAADALLFSHIAGGAVGLVSGAAALVTRKGSRTHRVAGVAFCVSMIVMAAIGAAVSPYLPVPQRANVLAGILTLYFVVSAWAAVRRKTLTAGPFEVVGLGVALVTAGLGVLWAIEASRTTSGTPDGSPPQDFYAFIVMGSVAALGDLKLIVSGQLSGAPRLIRHLWRMCFALLIAAASLFLGQPQVMPRWLRGSTLLLVPTFAPLAWMIFWIIRLRLSKTSLARILGDPAKPGASDNEKHRHLDHDVSAVDPLADASHH